MAILISGSLNHENVSEYKDKGGRYLFISVQIQGNLTTVMNVYASTGSDWVFYKHI